MLLKSLLLLSIIFAIGFGTQESFAEEFLSPIPVDPDFRSISDPNTALVNVNPDLLSQDSMNITIFGETTTVTHDRTIFRTTDDFTYIGSTPGSFENVYIAYLNGDMRLELTSPGNNYVLEPSGQYHSITQFDELIFGPDQEEIGETESGTTYQELVTEYSDTAYVVNGTDYELFVDVIYVYTPEAAANVSVNAINLMGNVGIDKTNSALSYAGIDIQLRNVGITVADPNHIESGSMGLELGRLIDVNDAYYVTAASAREEVEADVGFLFIDDSRPGLCGRVNDILSVPETSYLAVDVDNCSVAPMGSVLAHEFGHLAGGHHDITTNGRYANLDYLYGHGYSDNGEKLDTLMAYACRTCDWQNVWSDPDNVFQGTDVKSGTYEREDNARVFNQTVPFMTSYKGEVIVVIDDVLPPVIRLYGYSYMQFQIGGTYHESGGRVDDNDPLYDEVLIIGGDIVDTSVGGYYFVTYDAPADLAGNVPVQVIRTVRVIDLSTPPMELPPDYTTEATGYRTSLTSADYGFPTVINDSLYTASNKSPGSFVVGTHPLIWTVTDFLGNTSKDTQLITIIDTTVPTLSVPNNITVNSTSSIIPLYIGYANASDIAEITVDITNDNNNKFNNGATLVTWTAIDASGNTVNATQSVTVNLLDQTLDNVVQTIDSITENNNNLVADTKTRQSDYSLILNSLSSEITQLKNDYNSKNNVINVEIEKLKIEKSSLPDHSAEQNVVLEKIRILQDQSRLAKFNGTNFIYDLNDVKFDVGFTSKNFNLDEKLLSTLQLNEISKLDIKKLQIDGRTTPEKMSLLKQISNLEIKIRDVQFLTAKNINNSELKIIELKRLKSDLTHQTLLVTDELKDDISDLQRKQNEITYRSGKLTIQAQIVPIANQIKDIDNATKLELLSLSKQTRTLKNEIKQLKSDLDLDINLLKMEIKDLKSQLKQQRVLNRN